MKLVARLVMTLSLTTAAASLAGPAAAEPTLRDLLADTSRSIQEMNRASLEVVQAQKAYDDQMAALMEAARGLATVFAKPEPEPKPTLRLESLRLIATKTPKLDALRLGEPTWQPKPILMHPSRLAELSRKPTLRLADLLLPKPSVASLLSLKPITARPVLKPLPTVSLTLADLLARANDPNGTSIYDRLSFK